MHNVKILDVTLRDGGCVNNFNFGKIYMEKILSALEQAEIDIIELGYIDQKNGSISDRTQYASERCIKTSILAKKKTETEYVAMVDYGKYDLNTLKDRQPEGIDGIRLAFHKKDIPFVIEAGKTIIDKGYNLYIQPMVTLRYSDTELLRLIDLINESLYQAKAFYIVDSFGEMKSDDVNRILNLVNHNLFVDMPIGLHSHNNLQMSYSNAISMLQFSTTRDIIIDSSIMGMGKGAGNLNTELLIDYLNFQYNKNYNSKPLLKVIDTVINQIHSEFYWGYAPEYYLSAKNHCSPTYASFFYDRHMLSIEQVSELIGLISEDKKISFDRDYAEKLYRTYNSESYINDANVLSCLKTDLLDKEVVLVAPGKSLKEYTEYIKRYIKDNSAISIGLNVLDGFEMDYILVTREDVFIKAIKKKANILVMSNISKGERDSIQVLDYKRWINNDNQTHDSSTDIILNILVFCGCKKITLAGFDGFSVDINENYYDDQLRHPVSSNQAVEINSYYKSLVTKIRQKGVDIKFLTKSKYE